MTPPNFTNFKTLKPEDISWLKSENRYFPKAFKHFNITSGNYGGQNCIVIPHSNGIKVYTNNRDKNKRRFSVTGKAGFLGDCTPKDLILLEGESDTFSVYEIGFKNVITCTTGCSGLTEDLAQKLSEKNVTILYDNDKAGEEGALKTANLLFEYCSTVKIASLKNKTNLKDVREYIQEGNASYEDIEEIIKSATAFTPNYENFSQHHTYERKARDCDYPFSHCPQIFHEFYEVASEHTDAPKAFLYAAAISFFATLSSSFLRTPNGISTNLFMALVGKTAATRKTTTQNIVTTLLEEVISQKHDLTAQFKEEKKSPAETYCAYNAISNFSVEGIESAMQGAGFNILITPGEYRLITEKNIRQNQSNTITTLTSMYDCRPMRTVLRGECFSATDYQINLLSCSTEEWIKDAFSKENILGGFINRHLIILANPNPKLQIYPKSLKNEKFYKLRDKIVQKLKPFNFKKETKTWTTEIQTISFKSDQAKLTWEQYATEFHEEVCNLSDNASSLMAREQTIALKLATISAWLNGRSVYEVEDILFGVFWAQKSTMNLFSMTKQSKLTPQEEKLFNFINSEFKKCGEPITKTKISNYFGNKLGTKEERHKLIDKMVVAKILFAVLEDTTLKGYVPTGAGFPDHANSKNM